MANRQGDEAPTLVDAATALDAQEVEALFASLRDSPRAVEDLRQAFDRVKDKLTPEGREAYRNQLARHFHLRPTEPRHLAELGEGDYAVEVMSEDGLSGRAVLSCRSGVRTLSLPLWALGERRFALDELGRVRSELVEDGARLSLRGAVAVRLGYVRLELYADGVIGSRPVKALLIGAGDARSGHA